MGFITRAEDGDKASSSPSDAATTSKPSTEEVPIWVRGRWRLPFLVDSLHARRLPVVLDGDWKGSLHS